MHGRHAGTLLRGGPGLFTHRFEHLHQPRENLVDLAGAFQRVQLVLLAVVLDQRLGLRLVHAQAVADGFLVVVGAVVQRTAALVALAVDLRRRRVDVVHLAADFAGAAAGKTLDQAVEIDVHENRGVHRLAEAHQHLVQRLGLRNVAREAVHDETVLRIRLLQALADDAEHDLVGDQLARVHRGLGLLAQLGAGSQRLAEQVARGNLGDAVLFDQLLGLRPLARTGSP